MRQLGGHVAMVLLMLALIGCTEPPPERVLIADLRVDRLFSGGDALFAAQGLADGVFVHEIRDGELGPAFAIPRDERALLTSLVATASGEVYWAACPSVCAWETRWRDASTEPRRIGWWDGTEIRWIDVPGEVILAVYEDSVWAQARDADEQVLYRIEDGRAIETRRDAYDEDVYIYAVLPSGHVVRTTNRVDAEEIDETGAVVGPFPPFTSRFARDDWSVEVTGSRVTFTRDGGSSVSVPYRGRFAGAGPATSGGIDWVSVTEVTEGFWSNGDPIVSKVFGVEHFDGTSSSERFRTDGGDVEGVYVVHGGSIFYVDEGALYEQPLR